ncbi:MAG: hypothetical protein GY795_27735 [Desulfobacterales bacterium]|nr:hypothetical protein [Desulfobacterales bacterium]
MKEYIIIFIICVIGFAITIVFVEDAKADLSERVLWVEVYQYNRLTRIQTKTSASVYLYSLNSGSPVWLNNYSGSLRGMLNSEECYSFRVDGQPVGCGSIWLNLYCFWRNGTSCIQGAKEYYRTSVTYYK